MLILVGLVANPDPMAKDPSRQDCLILRPLEHAGKQALMIGVGLEWVWKRSKTFC